MKSVSATINERIVGISCELKRWEIIYPSQGYLIKRSNASDTYETFTVMFKNSMYAFFSRVSHQRALI
jgi:hypothetical protein